MNFKVKMKVDKETKNTIRFQETGTKGADKIGTLYIQQSAFGDTTPEVITVEVAVAES